MSRWRIVFFRPRVTDCRKYRCEPATPKSLFDGTSGSSIEDLPMQKFQYIHIQTSTVHPDPCVKQAATSPNTAIRRVSYRTAFSRCRCPNPLVRGRNCSCSACYSGVYSRSGFEALDPQAVEPRLHALTSSPRCLQSLFSA